MSKASFLFTLSAFISMVTFAQTETVGKMKVSAFNNLNAQGAKMVKAIKPTKAALSNSDQSLFMQVAMGGQKQLAISQAVLNKATDEQVKLLAQSEVEEQTTVAAKLTEMATAKGVTLPAGPDATAEGLLSQISGLSGAEVDAFYIAQSGIKGHQELQATMTKVNKTAKDLGLKALATATLPVIRLHLKVSTDVQTSMKASGGSTAQ